MDSFDATLDVVTSKWKLQIICRLLDGPKRFGYLFRSMSGISKKVLTENLRAMEKDGLIMRTTHLTKVPYVEYCLSDIGYDFLPIINAMSSWGNQ